MFSELMPNPRSVSDSNGEWIEIYNPTDAPIDIGGMLLYDNPSNQHTISGSVVVPSGGYALLARNGDPGVNGGLPTVDYVYSSVFLNNSGGDTIELISGGVLIAEATYSSGTSGRARVLECPDSDTGGTYDNETVFQYNGSDYGTPAMPNGADADLDGVTDNCDACPQNVDNDADGDGLCGLAMPCDLVVSEVMANPKQAWDSNGEWFEVYNRAPIALNLRGLVLADNFGSHTVDEDVLIQPGQSALLAVSDDASVNGGLVDVDYVYPYSSLSLSNSGDEVTLSATATAGGTALISQTLYSSATSGVSIGQECPVCDPVTLEATGLLSTSGDSFNGGDDFGTPGATFFEGDADLDGFCGADDLCPDSVIPEFGESDLNPNHYGIIDDSGVFAQGSSNGNGNGNGVQDLFTLDDTLGCTCTDIVDALGLGGGQLRHGCSPGTMRDWVQP